MEKRVFKCPLKRAGRRFTDSKLRTDLRLRRAMNFDIDLAAFRERRADRGASQLRRVAVAAEMSEHHALDFPQKQFLDDVRRRYV